MKQQVGKKCLALLLTACMLLGFMPMGGLAAEPEEEPSIQGSGENTLDIAAVLNGLPEARAVSFLRSSGVVPEDYNAVIVLNVDNEPNYYPLTDDPSDHQQLGLSIGKNYTMINSLASGKRYFITGSASGYYFQLNGAKNVTFQFNDVTMSHSEVSPLQLTNSTLTLVLADDSINSITSSFSAGIRVLAGSALTIEGGEADTGTLTAQGGTSGGAGIGGSALDAVGAVTINGGNVTATGGIYVLGNTSFSYHGAAGIGGGYNGTAGTVTINGGTVTATGGSSGSSTGAVTSCGGAGIGGGSTNTAAGKDGGTITITGGTVTATGGASAYSANGGTTRQFGGAGIGGGATGSSGSSGGVMVGGAGGIITITGGTITATASAATAGAGIGGGAGAAEGGSGGTINISGGTIFTTGRGTSWGGAGIGGAGGGNTGGTGGDITISGGYIEAATGGTYGGAAIGGGGGGGTGIGGSGANGVGSGGSIRVEGGIIKAKLTNSAGYAIGSSWVNAGTSDTRLLSGSVYPVNSTNAVSVQTPQNESDSTLHMLTVTVTDADDNPIPGATVQTEVPDNTPYIYAADTDEDGKAYLWLPDDTYTVAASHSDYGANDDTVTVATDHTASLTIQLATVISITSSQTDKVYTDDSYSTEIPLQVSAENQLPGGNNKGISATAQWMVTAIGDDAPLTADTFDGAYAAAPADSKGTLTQVSGDAREEITYTDLKAVRNGVYWVKVIFTDGDGITIPMVKAFKVDNLYTRYAVYVQGLTTTASELYPYTLIDGHTYGIPYDLDGETVLTSPTKGYDQVEIVRPDTVEDYYTAAFHGQSLPYTLVLNPSTLDPDANTLCDTYSGQKDPGRYTITYSDTRGHTKEIDVYFVDDSDSPQEVDRATQAKAQASLDIETGIATLTYIPPSDALYSAAAYRVGTGGSYVSMGSSDRFTVSIPAGEDSVYVQYVKKQVITEHRQTYPDLQTPTGDFVTTYTSIGTTEYKQTAPVISGYVAIGYKIQGTTGGYDKEWFFDFDSSTLAPDQAQHDQVVVQLPNSCLNNAVEITWYYEEEASTGTGIPKSKATSVTVQWVGIDLDGTAVHLQERVYYTRTGYSLTVSNDQSSGDVNHKLTVSSRNWLFDESEANVRKTIVAHQDPNNNRIFFQYAPDPAQYTKEDIQVIAVAKADDRELYKDTRTVYFSGGQATVTAPYRVGYKVDSVQVDGADTTLLNRGVEITPGNQSVVFFYEDGLEDGMVVSVLEDGTDKPIANATVTFVKGSSTVYSVITTDEGVAFYPGGVSGDQYRVTASAKGYITKTETMAYGNDPDDPNQIMRLEVNENEGGGNEGGGNEGGGNEGGGNEGGGNEGGGNEGGGNEGGGNEGGGNEGGGNEGGGNGGGGNGGGSNNEKPVLTEAHIAYLEGDSGKFRPDDPMSRAEIAVVLFRLVEDKDKNDPIGSKFSDITYGTWYSQAVNYLAEKGILSGYPNNTFRPADPLSRAELTAILSRLMEMEEAENPFPDVRRDHWAVAYIANAYSQGWIAGYPDGTFRPENSITRAEVVAMVNRCLGRTPSAENMPNGLPQYTDLAKDHWAWLAIMEASFSHEYRGQGGGESWTSW